MPTIWKTRTVVDNTDATVDKPRGFIDEKSACEDYGDRVKAVLPVGCQRAAIYLERSDPIPHVPGKVTSVVKHHRFWLDENGKTHSSDMSHIVHV